ncbi:hypothetical protein IFR05_017004, partial [Cadophora sp. M221]
MLSNIVATTAFLSAVPAIAMPANIFSRDHGPDNCADMYDDGVNGNQCYAVNIGFYSDRDCINDLGTSTYIPCFYTYCDIQSGTGGCLDTSDLASPYYAKLKDWSDPNVQVYFTLDQSCPPSGPAAVFASLIGNDACVEISQGGSSPGVTVFPKGGGNLTKRNGNATVLEMPEPEIKKREIEAPVVKKRDPSCSGFTVNSQTPSYSPSVQVSDIVNCASSTMDSCAISTMVQHTESLTTSYSLEAGGGIEGIFNIGATFGMEYTESTTTGLQADY